MKSCAQRYPMSVRPDNMYSVSICILYCRFETSPLACGFSGSGLPQVAKSRDCLSVFISKGWLSVAEEQPMIEQCWCRLVRVQDQVG